MSFRPTTPGPGFALARLLLASVFVVMGAWRLWGASQGVSTSGATLTFSAIDAASNTKRISLVGGKLPLAAFYGGHV